MARCPSLKQAGTSFAEWLRGLDWALIVLTAGFVVTVTLIWIHEATARGPYAEYKRAIIAAAIKRTDYNKAVKTVEKNTQSVQVVTVRRPGELKIEGRTREMWVALKSEAQAACKGVENPLRKLQQTFGLQPDDTLRVVTELEVPAKSLVRPCVSDDAVDQPACSFEFPKLLPPDADAATVRARYERLSLVASQMWYSYREGFPRQNASAGDYPYQGFPFTGMGWSYNWSSESADHYGATEFVIFPDTEIKKISDKSPAEFCASK